MGRKQSDNANDQNPSLLFYVAPFLTEKHLPALTDNDLLPLALEFSNLKTREFYEEACKATVEAQKKLIDVAIGKSKGGKTIDDEKQKFCAYMRELANKKAKEFESLVRDELKKKEAEVAAKCGSAAWMPAWSPVPWYPPPPLPISYPIGGYMPVYTGAVRPPAPWGPSWPSPSPPPPPPGGAQEGKKKGKGGGSENKGAKPKGKGNPKNSDDSDSDDGGKASQKKGKRNSGGDNSSNDSSDDGDSDDPPAQKAKAKPKNKPKGQKPQQQGDTKGGKKSVRFSEDNNSSSSCSIVNPYVSTAPGIYSVQHGYVRYDYQPEFGAGGQHLSHKYRVYIPPGGWPDEGKEGRRKSDTGKSGTEPAWMEWGK
ncbi:hypothetical protein AX16_010109 [Volvariella volvacea WC 439]|nr:hypothetical protein AX16_010109 [Volvariella volvacea WC 439]